MAKFQTFFNLVVSYSLELSFGHFGVQILQRALISSNFANLRSVWSPKQNTTMFAVRQNYAIVSVISAVSVISVYKTQNRFYNS